MKKLAGLSITLAILAVIVGVIVFYPRTTEKPVQSAVNGVQTQEPLSADKIFQLVNQERIKAGVPPLIRDAELDKSAQSKADDMAINNYFDHISPLTGKHGYEYIPYRKCLQSGENIFWLKYNSVTEDDNKEVVTGWLESKPHHDALLNPNLNYAGLGQKNSKTVMHFCQM